MKTAAAVTAVTASSLSVASGIGGGEAEDTKTEEKRKPFIIAARESIAVPTMPYGRTELEPVISGETVDYHFGKHHVGYYHRLKELMGGAVDGLDLVELIRTTHRRIEAAKTAKTADVDIYNAAGQLWNHNFYWAGLRKKGEARISQALEKAIQIRFGGMEGFKTEALKEASSIFGSGWLWLCMDSERSLSLVKTSNADSPLTQGLRALLVLDVWEHAYYIDYRSSRANHLKAVLDELVNWQFVQKHFDMR